FDAVNRLRVVAGLGCAGRGSSNCRWYRQCRLPTVAVLRPFIGAQGGACIVDSAFCVSIQLPASESGRIGLYCRRQRTSRERTDRILLERGKRLCACAAQVAARRSIYG